MSKVKSQKSKLKFKSQKLKVIYLIENWIILPPPFKKMGARKSKVQVKS